MLIEQLPNNLVKFKNTEWRLISPANQGMKVYVKNSKFDQFNRLKKKAKSEFNAKYLFDQLRSLNNRHGLTKSIVSKFKHQDLELKLEGGSIKYTMVNGTIFVGEFTYSIKKPFQTGLYEANWSNDYSKYTATAKKSASTSHIAVNGAFGNIDEALKYMPEFIERGYKPNTTKDSLKSSGYNIFFNNCGEGIKSDMRQFFDNIPFSGGSQSAIKLSKLIKIQAKYDKEIFWTLHEKGHALFRQALQLALKELLPSEIKNLANHKVFYANPTINLSFIDHYRKKSGMQLAPQPPLMNNFSIEQTWVSGNFISETHVSYKQLKEQGENGLTNVTPGHIIQNALSRSAMVGIGTYALPTALSGVAGWALTWATLGVSNIGSGNKHVIESGADVINHFRSKA